MKNKFYVLILLAILFQYVNSFGQHWIQDYSKSYEFDFAPNPVPTVPSAIGSDFLFGYNYNDCYAEGVLGLPPYTINTTYVHDFCKELSSVSPGNLEFRNVNDLSGQAECLSIRTEKVTHQPYEFLNPIWVDPCLELQWRSGMIYSIDSYHFGKLEFRCKLPRGKGFWSAIWLWDGDGEIDLLEIINQDNGVVVHPSWNFHSPNYCPTGVPDLDGGDGGSNLKDAFTSYPEDLSAAFHLYTLDWSAEHLIFYIDNKMQWVLNPNQTNFFPLNPLQLIIGSGVAAPNTNCPCSVFPPDCYNLAATSNPTPDAQTGTDYFDIDYIRYYYEDQSCKDYTICEPFSDPYLGGHRIHIGVSKDINDDKILDYTWDCNQDYSSWDFTCNKTVLPGNTLDVVAEDYIMIHDGFEAQEGSNFTAQIIACSNQRFISPFPTESISSVITPTNNNNITIEPNPTADDLNIHIDPLLLKDNSIISYSIFNLFGTKLLTGKNEMNLDFTINLSKFIAGSYYIKFYDQKNLVLKNLKFSVIR